VLNAPARSLRAAGGDGPRAALKPIPVPTDDANERGAADERDDRERGDQDDHRKPRRCEEADEKEPEGAADDEPPSSLSCLGRVGAKDVNETVAGARFHRVSTPQVESNCSRSGVRLLPPEFVRRAIGHRWASMPGSRRLVYVFCYAVLIASGRIAARLAGDFRALGSLDRRFTLVSRALQFPVLACWLVVRPISLAAFAACCALAPGYE
jgi:hypothetical protein